MLPSTIRHTKIKTKGHVVPDYHVVQRFFLAVDETLSNKKDALIGVHCTHGVNRTGYLICRYLIEKLDWDPQKAIDGEDINFETVFCCRLNSKKERDSSLASFLFELKHQ